MFKPTVKEENPISQAVLMPAIGSMVNAICYDSECGTVLKMGSPPFVQSYATRSERNTSRRTIRSLPSSLTPSASSPAPSPKRSTSASVTARVTSCAATHSEMEEHTSELQSLMRISYAVFCLKKKKSYKNTARAINMNQTST